MIRMIRKSEDLPDNEFVSCMGIARYEAPDRLKKGNLQIEFFSITGDFPFCIFTVVLEVCDDI